ncbi:hypothetical protein AVEN_19759-1, partial [Araneus ventricosus]
MLPPIEGVQCPPNPVKNLLLMERKKICEKSTLAFPMLVNLTKIDFRSLFPMKAELIWIGEAVEAATTAIYIPREEANELKYR